MSTNETNVNKMCTVRANLSSLYDSGLHSDLTILVNGEEIKAHKAVLSCRCAVFAAMLSGDFVENKTSVIKMNDIDTAVTKNLLRFIYSGDVEEVPDTYEGLLSAADKYGLAELTEICGRKMALCLDRNNAARYLLLSDRHNSKKLKTTTVDYIRRNSDAVHSSKGWKDLKDSSSKLILETLYEGSPTEESYTLSPADRSKQYEAHIRWRITGFNRACWELGDCMHSQPFRCPAISDIAWRLMLTPVLVVGVDTSPVYRAKLTLSLEDSKNYPVTAHITVDVLNGSLKEVTSVQGIRRVFDQRYWPVNFSQVLQLNLENDQTTLCCTVVAELSFYRRMCLKMRTLMKF